MRAPTHHSFTFNLRFLHELKHKVRPTKNVCRTFYFRFHFHSFLLKFIFLFNQMYKNNRLILFKNKRIQPHTVLLPDIWVAIRSFTIQLYVRELELFKNLPGDKSFKPRKSKFWERRFFRILTCEYMSDIALLINLFICWIEIKSIHWKHQIKERRCKFKIDEITYLKS